MLASMTKVDVDDQKFNSDYPHNYLILECLFYKILNFFFYFSIQAQVPIKFLKFKILKAIALFVGAHPRHAA